MQNSRHNKNIPFTLIHILPHALTEDILEFHKLNNNSWSKKTNEFW